MRAGAALGVLAMLAGCSRARPVEYGAERCTSWKEEIAPLFSTRCATCHAGAAPAARYDTATYLGVLGGGQDSVPNAVAGDPSSLLLQVLSAGAGPHQGQAEILAEVRRWVVDCRLSYVRSSIHPGGILDPSNAEEFHGAVVRSAGWDFKLCAECHGADFGGGKAQVACTACHGQGPTDCQTCHANQSLSGAHTVHVRGGPLQKPLACTECHVVPEHYTDLGHLFGAGGTLDPPPAEVTFGPFAGRSLAHVMRPGPPDFDPSDARCSNVYCHGGALADARAQKPQPVWTAPGAGASCGSCHGLPPASHGANTARCALCHWSVTDAQNGIADTALHLDGEVQVADRSGSCAACHGEGDDPAPPRDLSGQDSTASLGVGAHQSHLGAVSGLRGPIPCSDCHLVPAAMSSPGHLDSDLPAEVFPSSATLAAARGAAPLWIRGTASCSSVYCHGGGGTLAGDNAPGLIRAPVWTQVGQGQAACGTCHGIPPATATHPQGVTLRQCAACHPNTVGPFGNILVAGGTSAHVNGVVDAP